MKLNSFRELFLSLLSDIYMAENQLLAEMPKVIKKASSEALKEALQHHANETKSQLKRLESIFKIINEKPSKIEWSKDIINLFNNIDKFLRDNSPSALVDASIIVVMQRIEHFEIATYGTLKEFAHVMDNDEIKSLLHEALKAAGKADTVLTKLAKGGLFSPSINVAATHAL